MESLPTQLLYLCLLWVLPYIISIRTRSDFCFSPVIQRVLFPALAATPSVSCLGMGKRRCEKVAMPRPRFCSKLACLVGGTHSSFSKWGSPIYFRGAGMALVVERRQGAIEVPLTTAAVLQWGQIPMGQDSFLPWATNDGLVSWTHI